MLNLKDDVGKIPSVGPKYQVLLNKLGVETVHDLLYYLPTRHEDTSKILTIEELIQKGEGTIKVLVRNIQNARTRRITLTKAVVEDSTGSLNVVWFNQPFLKNNIHNDDEILLSGKVDIKGYIVQMKSPKYELLKEDDSETIHLGRITPVYQITEGLGIKWLRTRLKYLVDHIEDFVKETYDETFLSKFNLLDITTALKQIHFPENLNAFEAAQYRLAFDELLEIQKIMQKKRQERMKSKTSSIAELKDQEFLSIFDFELTPGQVNAIHEIQSDMSREFPMQRLLAGDVGSGKTAVAITASLAAIKSGKRVVYMAPTTLLAEQHYQTYKNYLPDTSISLLSGKQTKSQKEEALKGDILIGTQALLFANSEALQNIGLLIVDEQHRFGVSQREKLTLPDWENTHPHVLSLTATPIPRTLSLTLFGDIDVSYLETVPKGRLPIKTHIVSEQKRTASYDWIKSQIRETGAQVFFICPLVVESEKTQAKSAEETYKELTSRDFKGYKIALVHGQMKEAEKQAILQEFKDKKYDILVATPVIEVGIDIPGATIIVIENAERFGLAQLHQLRGRVGRNNLQSYCLAFYETLSEVSKLRLNAFAKETSGLRLAEYDIEIRGPGEVYGIRQAGLPDLHVASLTDVELIKKTSEALQLI